MEYSEEYMRDYLLGKLSPEAVAKLESEMESDPDLAEALELQRDIMIGIQAGFDDQLRRKLTGEDEGKIRSIAGRALWQWASAAAVVLGTLGVYLYMNQTTSAERLFTAYFEDYPNVIQPVQRDEPQESPAFEAYQNQRYAEAYDAFEATALADPTAVYPGFYKGICALHLGHWSIAVEEFEKVRAKGDGRFAEASTWYAGLAYLRAGNMERATLIFETLAAESGNFQPEAQALLDQLH